MGRQIEELVAEHIRLACPGGGLSPKPLDLRPDRPHVPPERHPIRPFVADEIRPSTGKSRRGDMLMDEHRLGLLGVGDAEQEGVG